MINANHFGVYHKKKGAIINNPEYSNFGNNFITSSSNIGLSTSSWSDGGGFYTADKDNIKWYIAANFANASPTRWGGNVWKNVANTSHVTSVKNLQSSSNTISISDGNILVDAVSLNSAGGASFCSWHTDGTTQQAYTSINSTIINAIKNGNHNQKFDSVDSSTAYNSSASIFWKPPTGTKEVMIDFFNCHSNAPCSLVVWNNSTNSIAYLVVFGYNGVVNSALNDAHSRTFVCNNNANYVYIITEHRETICGSHYFLYR